MKNKIYFGDNLDIMRKYIKDESIDLIYLDPPFNSNRAYNIIYNKDVQVKAFEDTWTWEGEIPKTYEEIITTSKNQDIIIAIKAFRDILGDNNLMAYLVMMTIRLLEMHRILKDTGSIYLHCDPTASHYLKIIMDNIFGTKNFQNEIVWHYYKWTVKSKGFQHNHDIIFRYSKTNNYMFNTIREIDDRRQKTLDRGYTTNLLSNGERQLIVYKGSEEKENIKKLIESSKFTRVLYRDVEGNPKSDVWDINIIHPKAKERTGYPTQKPLTLLECIVKASSNPGDVVLDPFCGCATALIAAHKLQRKWMGIDITYLSVGLLKQRLRKVYIDEGEEQDEFIIEGEPKSMEQVYNLIKEKGRFRFQEWVIVKIGGIPNTRKTGDKGIDGFYNFMDVGKTEELIISVKSGGISPSDIRDLRGTIERRNSAGGIFITLEEPTKGMRIEANSAGFFYITGRQFSKIQIITVKDILEGKYLNLPEKKE